jgi:hypothetical protein
MPRNIFQVSSLPVLDVGKMDIGAVQKLASNLATRAEAKAARSGITPIS